MCLQKLIVYVQCCQGSECELVPLKLKRKLSYKGHYLYGYVSPEKLTKALQWLKANNPLYADIDIANDWVERAIADNYGSLLWTKLEKMYYYYDNTTNKSMRVRKCINHRFWSEKMHLPSKKLLPGLTVESENAPIVKIYYAG